MIQNVVFGSIFSRQSDQFSFHAWSQVFESNWSFPHRHIVFAVNQEGFYGRGFAYTIARNFWPELEQSGERELGTVLSHTVGDVTFHALVCHSLRPGGWGDTPRWIVKCLNQIDLPSGETVGMVNVGNGLIGVLQGAHGSKILEAVDRDFLGNVVVHDVQPEITQTRWFNRRSKQALVGEAWILSENPTNKIGKTEERLIFALLKNRGKQVLFTIRGSEPSEHQMVLIAPFQSRETFDIAFERVTLVDTEFMTPFPEGTEVETIRHRQTREGGDSLFRSRIGQVCQRLAVEDNLPTNWSVELPEAVIQLVNWMTDPECMINSRSIDSAVDQLIDELK